MPLADPRRPLRPPRARGGFGRLWRFFLPGAIALMGLAIVSGVVDPDAGPAWIFALGVAYAVIGAASFVRHLWAQGRDPRSDDDPPSRGPVR